MSQALLTAARVVVEQAAKETLSPLMYAAVAGLDGQLAAYSASQIIGLPDFQVPNVRAAAAAPTPHIPNFSLSGDQESAWLKLQAWVETDQPFFVLRGFAGTGKTFLMQLLARLKTRDVYFTAPTNKATKVLSQAVGVPGKTTFSFLGIRLVQHEDQLVLEYGKDKPYIPKRSIIVVDEGSMTGRELVAFLVRVQQETRCKVLFVGDPAQLPPVGERSSPCWSVTKDPSCRAVLRQVMRNDNQLLALSMAIRACIKNKDWTSPAVNDNDGKSSGVFMGTEQDFRSSLFELSLEDFDTSKVIAWRNKTVDRYNRQIRQRLGLTGTYAVGERLLLATPIEDNGQIIAHTDEEFRIKDLDSGVKHVEGQDIPTWDMAVVGDQSLMLRVPKDTQVLDQLLARKANAARRASGGQRARLWKEFWAIKADFHDVRYGYALTAHRAQGSTYKAVYVDQADILANQEKREAFRCLYVGFTRPTDYVVTY